MNLNTEKRKISPVVRECAVIEIVRRRVQQAGLHEFTEQAITAAVEQYRKEPSSAYRAIKFGIIKAHEYEARFWK